MDGVKAEYWGDDYPVIIAGDHVTPLVATMIADRDIGEIDLYYGTCIGVKHCWAVYRVVEEGDNVDPDYDWEEGDSTWFIHESIEKPEGVTQKITIMEFDGILSE
jgi:hypothetical protein